MTRALANPLARAWAERELARAQKLQLRRLIAELRHAQSDLSAARDMATARREANMRQGGPNGFVLVKP